MNISEIDEKLMEFIYDKYEENSEFQTASTLVSTFEDESGIEFEDAGAQLEAVQRLMERGWIEAVSVTGKKIGRTQLNTTSQIKPTIKGIRFVEDKRRPWIKRHWPKVVSTLGEIIIRGVKKP